MLKKCVTLVILLFLATAQAEERGSFRCISNGLRQPLRWGKASEPRVFSRFRRKAMVDLTGRLQLVFPTYYMSPDKPIREIPFPNSVEIEAGIEPVYKMSNTDLDTSPRRVGDRVTYTKGDAETYKIVTVDLGDTVIKKGDWFGIWVSLENLDGEPYVPQSRLMGSSAAQSFESSYTSSKTSFIKSDFIRTATELPIVKVTARWAPLGYGPVAILAESDYEGDVWGIIGSSIPEGNYDQRGDQQGDENANLGYADKLISTKLGAPSVNLAKGSDRLMFCATQINGRADILKVCGVNKVHVGLGGNDLSGGTSLSRMKNDSLSIVKQLQALMPGVEVYGSTILPHSTSKDGFTSLEQIPSPKNAGPSSLRGQWNGLLRTDPEAAGYSGVYELCSFVEYDWENSTSKWMPVPESPERYTTDGTHPTCAGSEAIAHHAYLIDVHPNP